MPYLTVAITLFVAGLGVLIKSIKGLVFVSPLLRALGPGNRRPAADGLGIGRRSQCRPLGQAVRRAHGLTGLGVVVEGIERHALGIGQHAARHLHAIRHGILRKATGLRANQQSAGQGHVNKDAHFSPFDRRGRSSSGLILSIPGEGVACRNFCQFVATWVFRPMARLNASVVWVSRTMTLPLVAPSRPMPCGPSLSCMKRNCSCSSASCNAVWPRLFLASRGTPCWARYSTT